ncbi:MAG: flagellar export chaperone FlgN [Bacillota bacterium]
MEQLLELLHDKKKKINQIWAITLQKSEVIQALDTDKLEILLGKRQALMNEVDETDHQILSVKNALLSTEIDPAKDQSVLLLENDIKDIIKQIIDQDKENKLKLNQELSVVRKHLKSIKEKKAVLLSYGAKQKQRYGAFIDKKK